MNAMSLISEQSLAACESPNSICPYHADEVRDDRFTILDKLIRAGWGSVPMYVIEREIEKHGHAVLSEEPYIYR